MSNAAKTKDAPSKVQIINSGAKLRTFCGVAIGLGVSPIDAALADKIEESAHFQNLKAQGLMSISRSYPATKDKNIPEAEAQINQTHNKGLLDEYAADDHRPPVMKAIRKQHEELDKKPEASDKD